MKRICVILLAAAVLLAILPACVTGEEPEETLRLWFVSQENDGSLELGTEFYSGEKTIPAMMERLLKGPEGPGGLTSVIPVGTELVDWKQSGTTAQVDLSEAYRSLTGVDLTLADYCITLTLTQLEGVERVRITVNGANLPGRGRQTFRREDVLFSGAEEEPVELTAALCFRRAGGNELGEELRIFRLIESESATLAVLQALVAGPREAGLVALLPEGVEVYSARMEAGICYADFSSALLTGMPRTEEEQRLVLRSVVESLCSLGHVQAVQILVEGEPLTQYGSVDVAELHNAVQPAAE